MKHLRLIPDHTEIDFFSLRWYGYALSLIVIFGSLALFFVRGLNFGVDFTGGTAIEILTPDASPDLEALRGKLGNLGVGNISIQSFGAPNDLMMRVPQQKDGSDAQKTAVAKVRAAVDAEYAGRPVQYRRVDFVGPQVGEELKKVAVYAILFSMIAIVAYVTFRFEWQYGIGVVIALVHDVAGTIGFFAITQMEFDLSTLAAVLLVAGYSVNDTVIIFDRIRENLRKYKKLPVSDVINLSVNQTLSRTVLTSGLTLLSLLSLWLFGGAVIRGFTSALFLGIVLGTYSSIYVAAPFLIYLNIRRTRGAKDDAPAAKAA